MAHKKKFVKRQIRKYRNSRQKSRNSRQKADMMKKVVRVFLRVPWVKLLLLVEAVWPIAVQIWHHLTLFHI